ncbi:uncharacterized protein LOC119453069 isoform X2 [Dermacentor silvarum]|uniref:uncharacterized protein LOC119453069 isoform X2 n=1 Tax=Dermacentor silvarum TaxID=543639 RepID=UPI00210090EB|nr:uncharacterized protein LOC119453069 isoform X2 [Dermacentor silvarum]
MGRPRKVKTPEEQREYNARRKEQNRLAQQRRRQNPAALAQDAERKRQARQDPAYAAREAECMRRARQDPAYAAREAERKRQARRDDEERREAENAAKRRKYHADKLAKLKGINAKFKKKFLDVEFGFTCSVCDRLCALQDDLMCISNVMNTEKKQSALDVLSCSFPGEDVVNFKVCGACKDSLLESKVPLLSKTHGYDVELGQTPAAADRVKAQTVRVHRTERRWPLVMCPHHSTLAAEALGAATADFSAVFPDIDFKQAAEVACDKPPFIEASLVSTTCRVEPWRGLQDKCVGEYEAVVQHAERSCQTEHHITLVQCRKPQVSTCSVEVQADPWCQHHCGIGPIGVDLCET